MNKFATKSKEERLNILQEAANRLDLTEIVVEKDFWVCWVLKRIFSNPKLSSVLTFKGGTSLSKAYGLIKRFSEDVDLTISRSAPFLEGIKDLMEAGISSNERERRIKSLTESAGIFVKKIILSELKNDFNSVLENNKDWSLVLDSEDIAGQTILFYYPQTFRHDESLGYIKPHIKLEFGARGEIEPNNISTVTSYVAETFPNFFTEPSCEVVTLGVDRTFWEKVTILHALHHGFKMRDRMSRHYYDTYVLYKSGVAEDAVKDVSLLEHVVRNKSLLFRDAKASYETAVPGSIKLLPKEDQLSVLKSDYDKMSEMFMADYPDFDEVMLGLGELENLINN